MPVIPFNNWRPEIDASVFLAPTAWITGQCTIAAHVSIFFGAVLRGDIQRVIVGERTNIQEGALLHTSHNLPDCIVGAGVTIGHRAIVHGCQVEDNCIIGMGATILDGAVIGQGSIVGAQTLVTMHKIFPPRSLIMGIPGKVVRELTDKEFEANILSAKHYVEVGAKYREYFIQSTG